MVWTLDPCIYFGGAVAIFLRRLFIAATHPRWSRCHKRLQFFFLDWCHAYYKCTERTLNLNPLVSYSLTPVLLIYGPGKPVRGRIRVSLLCPTFHCWRDYDNRIGITMKLRGDNV